MIISHIVKVAEKQKYLLAAGRRVRGVVILKLYMAIWTTSEDVYTMKYELQFHSKVCTLKTSFFTRTLLAI